MESRGTLLKERYSVVGLLGRGGMGEVFLAEDQLLSRQVAVKKVSYAGNQYLLKTAENEARVLAKLRHQSLPKVLDYFSEGDAQHIVMEYVPGKDLGELLRLNAAPFPAERVWDWGDALLEVVEYLHGQSSPVVHRDIKPPNIKIADDGKLFLLDFGLVKDTPTRVKRGSLAPSVFGYSQSYAPPEQINGDPTSVQTDVYAVCATLYHLLTNVEPADALNRALKKIENKPDPLRPAHEVNPSVPPGLSQVLEAGLRLNCDERVGSARELRGLLARERNRRARIEVNVGIESDGYVSQFAPHAPPSSRAPGSKRFGTPAAVGALAGLGAVVLLAVSAVGYSLYRGYQEGRAAQALIAEARALEREEGLLSQNACAKYGEIVAEHLEQSARNELSRKRSSCASVSQMFQDAARAEGRNGLNHETAAGYRKLAELNPGTVYAQQAAKKVREYEQKEQATLRAYKAMQKADYESARGDAQEVSADELKRRSDDLLETINLYGAIDLTDVDPLLSDHIVNSVGTFRRGRALYLELQSARDTVLTNMEANIARYGEFWRGYYVAQAKTEFAGVLEKNSARIKTYFDDVKKLNELDKTYGAQLQTKFNNRGFVDQY